MKLVLSVLYVVHSCSGVDAGNKDGVASLAIHMRQALLLSSVQHWRRQFTWAKGGRRVMHVALAVARNVALTTVQLLCH
jgi:hypothetical protein